MAKYKGKINKQEAKKTARQITEAPREERLYGYEPGDEYAQGTPMA
ncbi:hypothetical protein [Desulforamulus ferrireducens]|nr:hypothetical protein [Desulforamulus ferrireducens]